MTPADIRTLITRYTTELLEGPSGPNYSKDGQSVDWLSYRKFLTDEIFRLNELLQAMEPFEIAVRTD